MRWLFSLIFKLSGWKIFTDIDFDKHKKLVLIGIPHTSNWDFIFGMGALDLFGLKVNFTIKKEWMKPPFGYWMKKWGAIGIDRSGKQGFSQSELMAKIFEKHDELVLVVTPEGTRSRREKWKTGFYYIAKEAKVPIVIGYLDYGNKEAGISELIDPEIGLEETMKRINKFIVNKTPKNPENFSVDTRFL